MESRKAESVKRNFLVPWAKLDRTSGAIFLPHHPSCFNSKVRAVTVSKILQKTFLLMTWQLEVKATRLNTLPVLVHFFQPASISKLATLIVFERLQIMFLLLISQLAICWKQHQQNQVHVSQVSMSATLTIFKILLKMFLLLITAFTVGNTLEAVSATLNSVGV